MHEELISDLIAEVADVLLTQVFIEIGCDVRLAYPLVIEHLMIFSIHGIYYIILCVNTCFKPKQIDSQRVTFCSLLRIV
jgi:hypothetical protein